MDTAKQPETVKVTDLNCRTRPRTHGDGLGGQVTFNPGEAAELAMERAAVFIGNDSFLVLKRDGTVLTKTRERIGDQIVTLRSDQVVAQLSELTRAALAARVEEATGDKPPQNAKAEDLIAVLVAARVASADDFAARNGRTAVDAGSGGNVEYDADGKPITPSSISD